MRRLILLCGLIAAGAPTAIGQVSPRKSAPPPPVTAPMQTAPMTSAPSTPPTLPLRAATCRGADLSVREVMDDAAMGGEHLASYALRNNSSLPCSLKGYPRYELLDKAGRLRLRGRAVNSQQLPGDDTRVLPQLVTLEAGKEGWFKVHYNSGGAGYTGKPCPVSNRVRIMAPGTTRPMIVKADITSCRTIEISTVRGGPVPE
ncbi:MAG: DUF4232 domain-containing protein [Acidobacteriota bacterium]